MPAVSNTTVPAETVWLCEHCGYVLTGLDASVPDGRCPECGKLTDDSAQTLRKPTAWEDPAAGSIVHRFAVTSAQVIFRPRRFYRTLQTRADRRASGRFAHIYWAIVSVMLAAAGYMHLDWSINVHARVARATIPLLLIGFALVIYGSFWLTTALAAQLTNWEGTYRGYRLPTDVVRRGLDYHAAHYLPVALIGAATVYGFNLLVQHNPHKAAEWGVSYLYVLSGEVIVCALYLFNTYWIAMRNMMYATR